MPLPLAGLLVVSLEQAVAAPMCTCRLADAGARVIKVERPEGDFARYYDKLAVPRGATAASLAAIATTQAAPASPPPFTGEGQGGGTQKDSCVRARPPPPPPPPPPGGGGRARGEGKDRPAAGFVLVHRRQEKPLAPA